MQEVVSASTGTTARGRPRNSGRSSCSTDAKYEFMSTNRYFTDMTAPRTGSEFVAPLLIRYFGGRRIGNKNPGRPVATLPGRRGCPTCRRLTVCSMIPLSDPPFRDSFVGSPPMIVKRCPGCETRFEFAEELDGKRVKCKSCGVIFRVDRPDRSARDDEDDEDRRRAARRRDEDEDDRPRPRARVRDDDDDNDDEQPSRTRRPVLEDDDNADRPRRRPRDEEDDDEEDGRRARRRRDDDSDDRLPRRRDD